MHLAIETAIDPSVLSTPEAIASVFLAFFGRKTLPPSATALAIKTNVTETYYMLEGAGVLVTGGTLRKPSTPRQSNLGNWTDTGSNGIEGGVSRRLSKGDVVIIPGGVPHGWASLEGDITYLIVRLRSRQETPTEVACDAIAILIGEWSSERATFR